MYQYLRRMITGQEPMWVAGAVFAGGYGALLVLWINSSYQGPHGLFYYPSATWGDGLLLPLAAAALVVLRLQIPQPSMAKWPTVVMACIGAIGGSLLVASWWRAPTPVGNWTLPYAHSFTFAGYWHSAFLIVTSGLFAGLWTSWLRHLRRLALLNNPAQQASLRGIFTSVWAPLLLLSTLSYAVLTVHDAVRAGTQSAGLGSLIALAVAAFSLLAAFAVTLRSQLHLVVLSLMVGCVTAFPVCVIALRPPHTTVGIVSAAAAALTGVALVASEKVDPPIHPAPRKLPIWVEALPVPAYLMLTPSIATYRLNAWQNGLVIGCLVTLPIGARAIRAGRRGFSSRYVTSWGITVSLLAACLCGALIAETDSPYYVTGGFVLTMVGAILGGAFLPFYRADFQYVMNLEGDLAISGAKPSAFEALVIGRTWVRIGGYSLAAFTALLALTIALAPSLAWTPGEASEPYAVFISMAVMGGLILLATWPLIREAWSTASVTFSAYSSARAYLYVFACLAIAVLLSQDIVLHGSWNLLSALDSVLISFFMVNCVVGNGARLHLASLGTLHIACAAAAGVATAVTAYWSLTAGLVRNHDTVTLGWSAFGFLAAAVLAIVTTIAGTTVVYTSLGRPFMTRYPPGINARQDTYLGVVLWLILCWLPLLTLTHIPSGPNGRERFAAVGSVVAGFLLLFGPAFLWVLENNDTHNGRERRGRKVPQEYYTMSNVGTVSRMQSLPKRVLKYWWRYTTTGSENERWIAALDGHTATQNLLALCLAAATGIGAVGVASAISTPGDP